VARLRQECTDAKEALSSDTDVTIPVILPGYSTEVRLTRAELETLVRPALYDSIGALQRAMASAGVSAQDLHSVLLVGGSSRCLGRQLVSAGSAGRRGRRPPQTRRRPRVRLAGDRRADDSARAPARPGAPASNVVRRTTGPATAAATAGAVRDRGRVGRRTHTRSRRTGATAATDSEGPPGARSAAAQVAGRWGRRPWRPGAATTQLTPQVDAAAGAPMADRTGSRRRRSPTQSRGGSLDRAARASARPPAHRGHSQA
jgi:hypothetical protein